MLSGSRSFTLRIEHGLYAIGDQILEVVAPKQPGTTAERFLERRRGEGGYMVLLQTENIEQHKSRLQKSTSESFMMVRSPKKMPP